MKLTPRETEVIILVASGLSNAEIARALWHGLLTLKDAYSMMQAVRWQEKSPPGGGLWGLN